MLKNLHHDFQYRKLSPNPTLAMKKIAICVMHAPILILALCFVRCQNPPVDLPDDSAIEISLVATAGKYIQLEEIAAIESSYNKTMIRYWDEGGRLQTCVGHYTDLNNLPLSENFGQLKNGTIINKMCIEDVDLKGKKLNLVGKYCGEKPVETFKISFTKRDKNIVDAMLEERYYARSAPAYNAKKMNRSLPKNSKMQNLGRILRKLLR